MLDHVGYPVSDYSRSKDFYSKALAALGCRLTMEIADEQTGGFGDDDPGFWIWSGKPQATTTHVAFSAKSRAAVDAFYAAALAAGGTDNGAPGLRPHYHASYYAAFVLDPDGNNIETVCHDPAQADLTDLRSATAAVPASGSAP